MGYNAGILIGAFLAAALMYFVIAPPPQTTRDQCRSENPGYECVIGWVKGKPFGASS